MILPSRLRALTPSSTDLAPSLSILVTRISQGWSCSELCLTKLSRDSEESAKLSGLEASTNHANTLVTPTSCFHRLRSVSELPISRMMMTCFLCVAVNSTKVSVGSALGIDLFPVTILWGNEVFPGAAIPRKQACTVCFFLKILWNLWSLLLLTFHWSTWRFPSAGFTGSAAIEKKKKERGRRRRIFLLQKKHRLSCLGKKNKKAYFSGFFILLPLGK